MPTNARKQNKHTPYLLISNGTEYGCYAELEAAKQIGRSLGYYQIRDLSDHVIDSSD